MLTQAALLVLGILMLVASLNDVFQSVIVPRAVGRRYRPSYYATRTLWILWPRLARLMHPKDDDAREDLLAFFAPTTLIVSLLVWSLLLIVGFGSIFFALGTQVRPHITTFMDAFYFAGTCFFTIGFGDYAGSSAWTRLASIAAGASGFGIISTTTAYLFALFGSFQIREQFVVTIGARAGSPPSGVGLITIAAHVGVLKDLPALMRSAESWCASVMETHLAYPVLAYFRSSHDYESWVGTLGTLLDASVLMMTTVECDAGEARIFYNIGRHATHDLSHYFRLYGDDGHPGIERSEFDDACERLLKAGVQLHEREFAWQKFSELRCAYAGHLNALAEYFQIPTIQWVGRRSLVQAEHMREQISEEALATLDQKP